MKKKARSAPNYARYSGEGRRERNKQAKVAKHIRKCGPPGKDGAHGNHPQARQPATVRAGGVWGNPWS
jgi:hypothetical protein